MKLSDLNPYGLYIKICAVLIAIVILFISGIWIRGVFAERDALKTSKKLADETVKMYADAWNRNAQLQENITNAIQKIRVESNTYIDRIETSAPPVAAAGDSIIFIAPGMPKAVPGLPVIPNNTTVRTGTTDAPGGAATSEGISE